MTTLKVLIVDDEALARARLRTLLGECREPPALVTGEAANAPDAMSLLARQRFASGLVDFQTVLDTQRSQLGTQDSLAQARASIAADHVRLYKALGGGWQAGDETAPTATPAAGANAAKPRITTP